MPPAGVLQRKKTGFGMEVALPFVLKSMLENQLKVCLLVGFCGFFWFILIIFKSKAIFLAPRSYVVGYPRLSLPPCSPECSTCTFRD